jgi:excisionase family DNA binding protein
MYSRVEPVVVTVADAAAMLSIGRSRVYELIQGGDLASVKIGASRRVTIKSIRKLLAEATEPPQRARRAA